VKRPVLVLVLVLVAVLETLGQDILLSISTTRRRSALA
jgi:hypothetical protein